MQRFFLPVGQGAFYCEKFSEEDFCGKVNVVYDCGSISGFQALKSMITWAFEDNESIDAVFLSHLHEDHINGLPLLMQRCHVKHVYLPMMEVDDLALMRLSYGVKRHPKPSSYEVMQDEYYMAERFVEDALHEPVEAIRRCSREYSQNRESMPEVTAIPIVNAYGVRDRAYTTSRGVFGDNVGIDVLTRWVYAPFNIRNSLDTDRVKSRFVLSFGRDMSASRIAELIGEANRSDDTLVKIRELYKGIKGGLNANSMTLFSGATDSILRQYPNADIGWYEQFPNRFPASTASGCLYTGDFIATEPYWSELKTAYRQFWPWIGCVQIPHHGSQNNFNNEFLNMTAYNVISVGFGNAYHHPSSTVLARYWLCKTVPFVVTQSPASIFSTTIK